MSTTSLTLIDKLAQPEMDEAAWGRFVELYAPLLQFWAPADRHRLLHLTGSAGQLTLYHLSGHRLAVAATDERGDQWIETSGLDFSTPKHVAVVYEPGFVHLFVAGDLVASAALDSLRPSEEDEDRHSLRFSERVRPPMFDAVIDEFRLSSIATYTESFELQARLEPDEHTQLLYHFDEGRYHLFQDSSPNGFQGRWKGDPTWVRLEDTGRYEAFSATDAVSP